MQHSLSEGAARWGLLPQAPLITQNCLLLEQVHHLRLLGIALPGGGEIPGAGSLDTHGLSHSLPSEMPPSAVMRIVGVN